jgi:hypothetical protein
MEWLVYMKIIHKAPNYSYDQNVICTYNKIVNQTRGRNKASMILFVTILSTIHKKA